jgi:hypothetical protein
MQADARIGQPDGAGLLDLERWMSIGDESVAEKKMSNWAFLAPGRSDGPTYLVHPGYILGVDGILFVWGWKV